MASVLDNDDDSLIIILGTSPGASMDVKRCNGVANGELDKSQIEDAMKELSNEANMAFKAQFHLGDSPSPASMMVASTIITEDRSTEELQKRFGDIIDENVVLKETLKQNNDSMKEQFMLIASCQEDMLKTHRLHKEKFDETRELVERLRQENKQLKLDISRLAEGDHTNIGEHKKTSGFELVTSPEDDTLEKLTLQLELVEKQRRQLRQENKQLKLDISRLAEGDHTNIGEHKKTSGFELVTSPEDDTLEKLTLQLELVEKQRRQLRQENKQLKLDISRLAEGDHTNIGEHKKTSGFELVTSPEDDTLEKLTLQLELVEKQRRQVILDNEKLTWQKESLEHIVDAISKERDDARLKLQNVELLLSTKETEHIEDTKKLHNIISDLQNKIKEQSSNVSAEDDSKRELMQQLESKLATLRQELKTALMKIHALENVKLEFSQYKSGASETVKMYKDQILELNNRIKEVQSTVFQPVRISVSSENTSSEFASHMSNIKLYDRTLKHLAELLNGLTHGLSDSLAQTLGVVSSLHELKYEPGNTDTLRTGLGELKNNIQTQHSTVVSNIGQIRGTLSIFEGIFKDHNELLKKTLTKTETSSPSVQQLTAALVARGQQLTALQGELTAAREHTDERDLLRAQVELYKSDFEAERESREKMASEKENLLADLRVAQKKIQDLTTQLEELRVLSPSLHRSITTMRPRPASRPPSTTATTTTPTTPPTAATGTATYTCPKCMTFSSGQYAAMEEHFEYCLDDF